MNFIEREPRKKLRLTGYDYRGAGCYFVTFCTAGRQLLFGEIIDGEMKCNEAGRMVFNVFKNLPNLYYGVNIDSFVVMPNHIHALIFFEKRTRSSAPTMDSLSDIIKKIKTYTTNCYIQGVYQKNWTPFDMKLWQRGYYEHIVQDDTSLKKIQEYILKNPLQWERDHDNPNFQDETEGHNLLGVFVLP